VGYGVISYLLRTPNFSDFASASLQGSFTTDHAGGVTHHQDTNEWVRIIVPIDNGLLIILSDQVFFFVFRYLAWDGNVDMSNVIINDRDEVDTGDFGDDVESLGVLPSLVYELAMAISS
jgi:hypothetical protein